VQSNDLIMVRGLLLLIIFIAPLQLLAQTGIGTTNPHPSAKLEVASDRQGFLPPQVSLTSTTDITTIKNAAGTSITPATGLLVYCKGDAGLAAGYYFWNGNAWATIATAGGSGSFASSYLRGSRIATQNIAVGGVVTFTNVDNTAGTDISLNTSTGRITLAAGNTYRLRAAVPNFSSGQRPAFIWYNETTTSNIGSATFAYNPGDAASLGANGGMAEVIITPNVNTVVSFRLLSSLGSGNVTVGANGDFSTTGSYPWFDIQVISGNAPVTGQSVDYIQASLSANQALSSAGNINFNVSSGAGITMSSGGFNLIANKTYKLEGAIGGTSSGYAYYGWVDNANNLLPGGSMGAVIKAGNTYADAPQDKAIVYFTPTTNTTVYLRVLTISGTVTAYPPNAAAAYSSAWANITQIGSSAIVNPWVLSGNDVYNTTGEVGIGTATPHASALLDLTSTTKAFLPPRMTTAQRNAISPATAGLVIYNTTINQLETYTGSSWSALYSGNAFHYAQYRANAIQTGFTADVTKVNFPTPVVTSGSIAISSGNTFTLPANRIYRVDINLGWKDGGWCRFAIYNASTGTALSQTAHMEGGAASGSGTISYFVDATAGSVNIDVRLKAGGCSLNDPNNGGTFATITIQSIF